MIRKFFDNLRNTLTQRNTAAFSYKMKRLKIKAFIYETEGITELQKEFYSRYISARYDKILTPAYDIVMEQRNDLTLK